MKKILSIILLVGASLNLKAQRDLVKGEHLAQPELKKFAGEWVYSNDTVTFTVYLRFEKYYFKELDVYLDQLQGDYTLTRNGKTIQTSVGKSHALMGGSFVDKKLSANKIRFLFADLGKSKEGDVTLELLDDNPNKAKWILTNTQGTAIGYYDFKFSIPTNMILKKVK